METLTVKKVSIVLSQEFMEAKDSILKGALEMFLRYGIKSITMDDISRALSVSKKTIYLYYEDKDALVSAAVQFYTDAQKDSFDKIAEESKNALEELIKCSDYIKSNVCNINPALLYDVKKYHPKAWNLYLDFRRDYVEKSVENTLTRGISEGLFRNNIATKILAKLRIETVEMGFNTEVFKLSEFETPKVQMEFFEHFTFGICTIKGHKLLNKYKQIHEED